MARSSRPGNNRVFRAVVVAEWDSGATSTHTYGPYERRADASRMVTRLVKTWRYRAGTASGWVETASVEWKPVDK